MSVSMVKYLFALLSTAKLHTIKVVSHKALSLCGLALISLMITSCSLFVTPENKPWQSTIEDYPAGSELTENNSSENDRYPESNVGAPNPSGKSAGFFSKIWHLIPLNADEKNNQDSVDALNNGGVSIATPDQSGWIWQDKLQKWIFKGNKLASVSGEQWAFESDAISIKIDSNELLNTFNNQAHPIVIKIIQLDNPKQFNELKQDPFALGDMLTHRGLDVSFLQEKELFLAPNEVQVLNLDREQNSQFIAILVGYYQLDNFKTVTRLIPLVAVNESIASGELINFWPFNSDQVIARPARLKLWLELGDVNIKDLNIGVH
jgi:type VI secretion system VasD/TssJ family lipoprotein